MRRELMEEGKVGSMVKHLMQIYFDLGINMFDIKVRSDKETSVIMIQGEVTREIDTNFLEALNTSFLNKRSPEIEEYYENLLDVEFGDNDYNILGSMVDYGNVEVVDGELYMMIVRNY